MNSSQQKGTPMNSSQQRAALLLHAGNRPEGIREQQHEACRRYCQEQGYQLSEERIYQGEHVPFDRDAPHLVRLRLDLVLLKFDVLVVPCAACLGVLPLWRSLSTANAIDEVYRRQARIESVVKRHGVHDIHQQMLLDGLFLIKQFWARGVRRWPSS